MSPHGVCLMQHAELDNVFSNNTVSHHMLHSTWLNPSHGCRFASSALPSMLPRLLGLVRYSCCAKNVFAVRCCKGRLLSGQLHCITMHFLPEKAETLLSHLLPMRLQLLLQAIDALVRNNRDNVLRYGFKKVGMRGGGIAYARLCVFHLPIPSAPPQMHMHASMPGLGNVISSTRLASRLMWCRLMCAPHRPGCLSCLGPGIFTTDPQQCAHMPCPAESAPHSRRLRPRPLPLGLVAPKPRNTGETRHT